VVLLLLVLGRFDLKAIQERHTLKQPENIETLWLTHNREVFRELQLPDQTVLFNVRGRHYIEAMFYTGCPAYNFIPTFEQYREMKQKGRKIAVFQSQGTAYLDYLESDTAILFIDTPLMGWD
jgi:4-amino-4-deoxy-L-arabinose transferase